MTHPAEPDSADLAPRLEAAYAAGRGIDVPPARAIYRVFPIAETHERVLLAVAEGIGDPPSAEAQSAETLGRLEAAISRASESAPPEVMLESGFAAADEAVERLMRLPGSVPGAGVALVAALIDAGTVTLANVGRGAAFLLHDSRAERLTQDQRWNVGVAKAGPRQAPQPLGSGGPVELDVRSVPRLGPGDALLLCSEAIARRLGERVIAAVAEEFPLADVPRRLTDLATAEAGADGAAVALYYVPADESAAPPLVVAAPPGRAEHRLLPYVVLAGAILTGVLIALGAVYALSRGDNSTRSAKPSPTSVAPVAALTAPPSPTAAPIVATPPASPALSATTAAPGTPIGSPSVRVATAAPGASPTPLVAANLPACDSAGSTPCRYTAKPGDSVSAIGDQFSLTRACFEAANRAHDPVPPQPPADRIGAAEDYIIPDAATCAALATGIATPSPAASPSAATTPIAACTPRPGASAPPPGC